MKTLLVLFLSLVPVTAFAGPELHPDAVQGPRHSSIAPATISENGSNRIGDPIRLVNRGREIGRNCADATWPYIPERCLTRGSPVSGVGSDTQ
jgi:hypothetical protein